ncbi:glutamine-hydrolyzing carbamoyl-phosphate synthase small subunit [Sedimentibacter saalensis]|jgi:carbamoyl-phosphate synthase small subunit|uniref:Carbamoyl phosphate synthase small chain n=1 Tax=Sedimentibacter saalensis TaxID=130788 RepID=A0A562J9I2_9FIRM|nr:glutamine-hydrolyzing carbamoyl-phosphate synthase small subunit [Sedimentibacter saalensis]TWH79846.1 carbamoyl-phosphate synthase small subunit [Sedimentibacter saalensis]
MKGKLILENKTVFEGVCFGKISETVGEVVFNTGMTGYQEILTDPSYYGQIVTMTYPLIGNYGTNLEDSQSSSPKVKGFIVREACRVPNNFRCEIDLDVYLKQNNIMGIEGIDTRELTKILRNAGTMKGIITTKELSEAEIQERFDSFSNTDAVDKVTPKEIKTIGDGDLHIGVLDCGIKSNILNSFVNKGCKLTIFPAHTSKEEIMKYNFDGIFLSNGPGDPTDLPDVIDTVKSLIGVIPVTGICLGVQIIALAMGAETEKMKFGHRGCNHPVKNLMTGKVTITSQNHGYMVKRDSLPEELEITHVNINDNTVEGVRHKTLPVMGVQYHPEACPGPHDSNIIFDDFIKIYKGEQIWV